MQRTFIGGPVDGCTTLLSATLHRIWVDVAEGQVVCVYML